MFIQSGVSAVSFENRFHTSSELNSLQAAQPSLPMPESMITAVRLAYSSARENSKRLMIVGQPRAGLNSAKLKAPLLTVIFFGEA